MRAHNGSGAVAVRRARFFQARPRRIEIKTSQIFRMPQAHRRSCDKNQPISFLTFSVIWNLSRKIEEQLIIAVQGFPELYDLSSPHYFDSNKSNNAESAADGCLATTDASGAQPPERFGKKEKAARLAFSTRFRRDMWTAPYRDSDLYLPLYDWQTRTVWPKNIKIGSTEEKKTPTSWMPLG